MTWTTLPDDWFDKPDVMGLSRSARLLDVEGRVWSNKALTDGAIPPAALRRMTDSDNVGSDLQELVEAGLWEVAESGYQIVDWTENQEPADKVRARREAGRERQARYRDRQERHARGDHSACDARYCNASRNASPDLSRAPSVTAPLSHPVQASPVPTPREGQGGRGPGAGAVRSLGVAPPPGQQVKTTGSRAKGWTVAPTSPPDLSHVLVRPPTEESA